MPKIVATTGNKRTGLSKSIRFEVFKRDKFTCQYCGKKAPDVVLNVDHVDPVANGGTNEIVNLLTSCFDCNSGKSDRRLDDNSAIEKQRKQMELLQERREQIGLMFEWKKSLSNLDKETIEMIKDYAHAKIQPFAINENGENTINTLLRKYGIEEVLTAIDISGETYLKYSVDGKPIEESVVNFIDKISGILFNRNLKPIDQKLALIKNKAKNAFEYFDPRKAAILLNQYVAALRQSWKYTDEQIIEDIDKQLASALENMPNWSTWKDQLEKWISDIRAKPEVAASVKAEERPQETLHAYIQGRMMALEEKIIVLSHLLSPYPNFDRANFKISLYDSLIAFVEAQGELSVDKMKEYEKDEEERKMFIWDYNNTKSLRKYWSYDYAAMGDRVDDSPEEGEKLLLFMGMEEIISKTLDDLFDEYFYFSISQYSAKDLIKIREMSIERLTTLMTEAMRKL